MQAVGVRRRHSSPITEPELLRASRGDRRWRRPVGLMRLVLAVLAVTYSNVLAIRRALEDAGITFIEDEANPGHPLADPALTDAEIMAQWPSAAEFPRLPVIELGSKWGWGRSGASTHSGPFGKRCTHFAGTIGRLSHSF